MNDSPHTSPTNELRPGKELAMIAHEIRACGLDVREHYHGNELVEVAVTNPRHPDKGRVSVGCDGRIAWEYSGQIEDLVGIGEVIATIVGLLTADISVAKHGERADGDTVD